MVRRGSTVRVRQRASGFFLLSSSFRCPSGRRLRLPTSTQRPRRGRRRFRRATQPDTISTEAWMLSAFHVDIPCEGGAVVPLADAVQQVDLDLARAMLHAMARPMGFPRHAVATDGNGSAWLHGLRA